MEVKFRNLNKTDEKYKNVQLIHVEVKKGNYYNCEYFAAGSIQGNSIKVN